MSAFLRELLASEAAMPAVEDVMAAIASREPVSYSAEDLRSFIEDERQLTYVVDCSIIIRLLAAKPEDELLRHRLARPVHAPALIDAEISGVVRGVSDLVIW